MPRLRVIERSSPGDVERPAPKVPPTHCVNGHPAMWCDCGRFVPAPPGRFTSVPMIRYLDMAEAARRGR